MNDLSKVIDKVVSDLVVEEERHIGRSKNAAIVGGLVGVALYTGLRAIGVDEQILSTGSLGMISGLIPLGGALYTNIRDLKRHGDVYREIVENVLEGKYD